MAFDIDKIRGDFPILSQKVYGKPLVDLDNAATDQKPAAVIRLSLIHIAEPTRPLYNSYAGF